MAALNYALHQDRITDGIEVIVIAVENNAKLDEYETLITPSEVRVVVRIYGRNPKECEKFDEIKSDIDNGYFKLAAKHCEECIEKCKYYLSRSAAVPVPGKILFVIVSQAYVLRNPFFMHQFHGVKVLLILDEPSFLRPTFRQFGKEALRDYADKLALIGSPSDACKWMHKAADAAADGRVILPETHSLGLREEEALKRAGIPNWMSDLRTIHSRRLKPLGGMYRVRPSVNLKACQTLVVAPVSPRIVQSVYPHYSVAQIGGDIVVPLDRQTRIYRIHHSCASQSNFQGNVVRICSLFVQIIIRRRDEGKNILLIAKLGDLNLITTTMNDMFGTFNSPCRVVPGAQVPSNPNDIPILNFGVSAINSYEDYHCCYAVNTYNADHQVISEHLSFCFHYQKEFNIAIDNVESTTGRIISGMLSREERRLANDLFEFHEKQVTLQAIGRIRPFTMAGKEVIVISRTPIYPGERVLYSLEAARKEFEVGTYTGARKSRLRARVFELFSEGMKPSQIAKETKKHRVTVHRILKTEGPENEFSA